MLILCGPFSKATPGDTSWICLDFSPEIMDYKQHLNTPLFVDLLELDGASVRGS